jgi:WD40 repeat protein
LHHEHEVWDAAFAPSGQTILTGSRDGTARFWDAASGRPLGPSLVHRRIVQKVAFRPDGKMAATAALGPTAWLWKVPAPVEGDAERLGLWARTRTGLELDDHGAATVLDGPAWEKYRQRLQELGGPPLP